MDLKKTQPDTAKLTAGVWVEYEDSKLLIGSKDSPKFKAIFQQKLQAEHVRLRRGVLSQERQDQITVETMAETVLLDWKNVQEAGVEIPYSKENAFRLLTDYPVFRDDVSTFSMNLAAYMQDKKAEAAENLGESSTGN